MNSGWVSSTLLHKEIPHCLRMWKHVSSILATAPNLRLLLSAKWRNICGFLPALKTSSQCDFFSRRKNSCGGGGKAGWAGDRKGKFIFYSHLRFPTLFTTEKKNTQTFFSRHHWLPILRQLRSRKIPRLRCWQMPHFPTAGKKSGASKKGSRNIGIRWLVFVGRRKKNSRTENKHAFFSPKKRKKIKIDAPARIPTAFSLLYSLSTMERRNNWSEKRKRRRNNRRRKSSLVHKFAEEVKLTFESQKVLVYVSFKNYLELCLFLAVKLVKFHTCACRSIAVWQEVLFSVSRRLHRIGKDVNRFDIKKQI